MKARTSETHPLQIAAVEPSVGGSIGMTICPGKRDPIAMSGPWERDLLTDLKAISNKGGLGLDSMQERAKQLGGVFQVDSRPGKGTTVKVSLDTDPKENEVLTWPVQTNAPSVS